MVEPNRPGGLTQKDLSKATGSVSLVSQRFWLGPRPAGPCGGAFGEAKVSLPPPPVVASATAFRPTRVDPCARPVCGAVPAAVFGCSPPSADGHTSAAGPDGAQRRLLLVKAGGSARTPQLGTGLVQDRPPRRSGTECHEERNGHMRSGAPTPNRPRLRASTSLVAAQSARRAAVRSGVSPSTRHWT